MRRTVYRTVLSGLTRTAPDFVLSTMMLAALLSAVLIPRYLALRERRDVAETRVRMRDTAMALDAYYVDHESFPPSGAAAGNRGAYEMQQIWQPSATSSIPTAVRTVNSFSPARAGARRMVTFRITDPNESFSTLTSPVAYLENGFRADPFATTRGASLGYFAHGNGLGWILISVGPDRDEHEATGPGEISPRVEKMYDLVNHFPYMWEPPEALVNVTYDPTNGIASEGDIYWAGGN